MFMPCSDESALAESAIIAFCAALNAPVVNIDALAVGPARAGIMIAAGEAGELNLWVRVSLISSGEGITFKFQGDPAEFRDPSAAIDAALSFSEGMGFLFEEDLLTRGGRSGRQRALKIWNSLCGQREEARLEVVAPKPTILAPRAAVAEAPAEIELTDALIDVLPSGPDDLPATAVGSPLLTKFRKGLIADRDASLKDALAQHWEETTDAPGKPGSEELGRVELVSKPLGNEVPNVSGFLTRLLSSFWVSL